MIIAIHGPVKRMPLFGSTMVISGGTARGHYSIRFEAKADRKEVMDKIQNRLEKVYFPIIHLNI